MQTDIGEEFYNSDVQRLMKKHNINHYSTYSVLKASFVERFNCTLKDAMSKFTLNGSYKWVNEFPRSCRITTRISIERSVCDPLLATVYSGIKLVGPAKFKIGDSVHVSKYKTIFEKGYANWTEVFKIVKVQRTNLVTYLFEDYRGKSIAGAFYEYKLRHANYGCVPRRENTAQEG
ncbi:hypothetical protein ACFW04_014442 [Cataglyphis niger]